MKNNSLFEIFGNGFMYVLTALQTKEVFQIISLFLSIIISLIIIIDKVVKWFKKAYSDGKITKEEIKELTENIKNEVEDIKNDAEELVEIIEIEEKER